MSMLKVKTLKTYSMSMSIFFSVSMLVLMFNVDLQILNPYVIQFLQIKSAKFAHLE